MFKLWLLLLEGSVFFYQLDKDVFFLVAVGMVGQLIELSSAVFTFFFFFCLSLKC